MTLNISGITRFQSLWRGHAERKKEGRFLSAYLLEKAKSCIQENRLGARPTGHLVYFPDNLPIVFKHKRAYELNQRFANIHKAKELCKAQGYKHLAVPGAYIYKDFLVEKRLPIEPKIDIREQMIFYAQHRDQLTEAVREFTALGVHASWSDLAGNSKHPFEELSKAPLGRYDNVPLYIENNQGKIGLVDLEYFSLNTAEQKSSSWIDAIYLFPYHFEDILSVVKQFNPGIEEYREELENRRDEALKRFHLLYHGHLSFTQQKGITVNDPTAFPRLEPARIEQIKLALEEVLRKELESGWVKLSSGREVDEAIRDFNQNKFPQVMEALHALIPAMLRDRLKWKSERGSVATIEKFLSIRTLEVDSFSNRLMDDEIDFPKFEMFDENIYGSGHLRNTLFETLFKELQKGGEIFYYNPSLGVGGHARHFILC